MEDRSDEPLTKWNLKYRRSTVREIQHAFNSMRAWRFRTSILKILIFHTLREIWHYFRNNGIPPIRFLHLGPEPKNMPFTYPQYSFLRRSFLFNLRQRVSLSSFFTRTFLVLLFNKGAAPWKEPVDATRSFDGDDDSFLSEICFCALLEPSTTTQKKLSCLSRIPISYNT